MDGGTIHPALLLILNVVIAALVSALTALGVSYFRTRGQNLATKHDFDELQKQLSENTKLVEAIKSEISHRDWVQRERTTFRRNRLEDLLKKMQECEDYLDQRRDSALEGKAGSQSNCFTELDTLAAHFSELKNEADRFTLNCRQQIILMSELGQAIMRAGGDPTARQAAADDFKGKWPYDEFLRARNALAAAAISLLERIMNVDERAPGDER
jgi:hypothetical protein